MADFLPVITYAIGVFVGYCIWGQGLRRLVQRAVEHKETDA